MVTSAWGIDLGTTNSCIARATAAGVEVIPIDEAPTVPSVLAWDGREFLVGRRAANHAVVAPDQAVRSIKRHMGEEAYRVVLGNTTLSPVEVSARILAYLKDQAQRATGETITDVVITVPAWFNEPQRRATVAAGEQAGLKVTRIINEPTAAALAYGHSTAATEAPAGTNERWLVYDLGGGTFDVSILSVSGNYKEVLASCGNTFLGGDDFDHRLVLRWVDHLRDRFNADVSEDRVAMAQLRHLAEQIKMRLSTEVEVRVQGVIDSGGTRLTLDETLNRKDFEGLIADYIESTIGKARQALEEAHVAVKDINRALLVGGSTRIPLVQARVAEELGIQPDAYVDVDLSVALGAALQSALDHAVSSAQIVVDVAMHSLGVAALGREDEDRMRRMFEAASRGEDVEEPEGEPTYPYTFAPVIRKNSRLPARFVEQFSTMVDNQEGIQVVVLQGESSNTRENTLVGAFHVKLNPKPARSPVLIGFEYDQSGMVRVTVSDEGGQKLLKAHTLDLSASVQSNSELSSLQVIQGGGHEEIAEGGAAEVTSTPKQLSNFLIEQIERQLASVPEGEMSDIRASLAQYRELLAEGRDAEIDEIEERLYAWLDERKAG